MNSATTPKYFTRLFEWFCNPDYLEELQGDLEEAFDENVLVHGASKAKRTYRIEVLKMLRPSVIRKLNSKYRPNQNYFPMLKNYFKTSYRSLMRNPLSSFINVFGLSIAIGFCLVVFAFINRDLNTDLFHEHKNEVYLATAFVDRDGSLKQYGISPAPLGEMLKEDFTQIKEICRIKYASVVLKHEDNVFNERVVFADSEYLEMFTFPMKWGVSQSLTDVNSIIFSKKMSLKYFNNENPIGQVVLMKFGNEKSKSFTISGVAEAFPLAHDIDFNFLVNYKNYKISDNEHNTHDWSDFVSATLIQVEKPSDIIAIEGAMEKYKTLQNDVKNDWEIESYQFEQLAGLHNKKLGEIKKCISGGYAPEGRIVLPIMGMFMLLLACFNYINIAIVSSTRRLKEIGIRKVIGANKTLVVIQFLVENIFITVFALLFGFFLGAYIFIPWFVDLFYMELELNILDLNLWMFLLSTLLFTGLVSGLYPAFYISKFDVVHILKGSVQFGNKNPLTKIFLGIQLILACITIVGGVTFTLNSSYIVKRSWGYNANDAIYVRLANNSVYQQLRTALLQNPEVLQISGSKHHLGSSYTQTILHTPEREYEVNQYAVEANYLETMDLEILTGRTFKSNFESDKQAVIINESLAKTMSWEQPIGEVFKIDSTRYTVIGLVKDFHARNFDHRILPTVFTVAEPSDYRYLSMRTIDGKGKSAYKTVKKEWLSLFPETPFIGGKQNEVFDNYYEYLSSTSSFMNALSIVAVLLASLGLYGLVTLNVSGRIKEFSIRKVLGAGIDNIAFNITKQYMMLFVIALSVGMPVSYYLIKLLIDNIFIYHIPMSFIGVLTALMVLIFVLMTVVSTQVLKLSKSNPVDGLMEE